MAKKPTGPTRLDDAARAALELYTSKLHWRLASEADRVWAERAAKSDDPVTGEDVERAFKRLQSAIASPRSDAQAAVTAAFRENRVAEFMAYGMGFVLFAFGVILLGYGAFGPADAAGRVASLVSGSIAHLLLLGPLRFAINARRQNLAIRIFGLLLDRVDSPRLLADLVRRLLGEVSPETAPVSQPEGPK
jgi:hypothetical protein